VIKVFHCFNAKWGKVIDRDSVKGKRMWKIQIGKMIRCWISTAAFH
jgi:hypothetical protein